MTMKARRNSAGNLHDDRAEATWHFDDPSADSRGEAESLRLILDEFRREAEASAAVPSRAADQNGIVKSAAVVA